MATPSVENRVRALRWPAIRDALFERGAVIAGPLLRAAECRSLRDLFSRDAPFRSRVSMERHQFGRGDYAYFSDPLPPLVSALRGALYRELAPLANTWAASLGKDASYPPTFARYEAQCRAGGQARPTPLLLRYRAGGHNRLHRDRYGPMEFPIQALVVLDRPGEDFEGGEFLVVENRARQQSIGSSFSPSRGELLLFAGGERPVPGKRGTLRATHRHGMSTLVRGERHALGIIFHNAS